MDRTLLLILLLLISPLFIFGVHVLVARLKRRGSPQINAVLAILVSYVPYTFLLWNWVLANESGSQLLGAVIYAGIVYSSIGYSYFHLFNMSETGRRIRIFCEIYEDEGVSGEKIYSLYGTSDVLETRLDRLVAIKQITVVNGQYAMRGKTLYYAARVVKFWGWLLGFTPLDQVQKVDQE